MWEISCKRTKKIVKEFNKQFDWDAPLYGEKYISLETVEYAQNKHKPVYFSSQPIQNEDASDSSAINN